LSWVILALGLIIYPSDYSPGQEIPTYILSVISYLTREEKDRVLTDYIRKFKSRLNVVYLIYFGLLLVFVLTTNVDLSKFDLFIFVLVFTFPLLAVYLFHDIAFCYRNNGS